ncbi:hypothetical protein V5O48_010891 [Marasmius crinis-equi]|uniref:Uncharacterized protein n=1 Tax=Marasmius crinis-equi TaxID=585013 RepID=A0ABR3F7K0_9AGAR
MSGGRPPRPHIPVPDDIRKYLLNVQLGIRLPFEIICSGDRFEVGVSSICVERGSKNGGQMEHQVTSVPFRLTGIGHPTQSWTPTIIHDRLRRAPLQCGVLSNLLNVCCGAELGRCSHEHTCSTYTIRSTFQTDFVQLM